MNGREKIRVLLKSTLGRTRVWPFLLKTRFYTVRLLARFMWYPEYLRNRLAVRLLPSERIKELLEARDFYGKSYFDALKSPLQESGYGEPYQEIPDFQEVARLCRDLLGAKKALDIGCAKGFLVLALLRAGIEAWGIDISEYALSQAPPEIRERLRLADVSRMDLPENSFDLLLALEVLEHVPPEEIAWVVERLRRVTSRYLLATIPSYGHNPYGKDGCLEGKIIQRRLALYRQHLIDRAELHHMTCDLRGLPIHGHLIAASYEWWTALFTSRGFVRRGDLERVINQEVRSAREGIWNCYLLEKVHTSPEQGSVRLERGGFSPLPHGGWESAALRLPAGIYRVEIALRLEGSLRGKRADERALTLSCLSGDGERIYGMRLPTRKELDMKTFRHNLELDLVFSCDGRGTAVLRLAPTPGIRVEPLRVNIDPLVPKP